LARGWRSRRAFRQDCTEVTSSVKFGGIPAT
jgi:hypothetical protein